MIEASGSNYSRGAKGGETAHKTTGQEMPKHNHAQGVRGYYDVPGTTTLAGSNGVVMDVLASTYAGGDVAHNNMQPYLALTYIIKI